MTLERDLVSQCDDIAKAMNAYVEWLGQRRADKAGQSVGTPDGLLYCGGRCTPLEFKRAKAADGTPAGRLSLGQIVAAERRAAQGVETHVIDTAEGFVRVVNDCRKARGVKRTAG